MATSTATQVQLRARYFDTSDRRLAAAKVALRLRREGPCWVQTLKAQGAGPMSRLEHEVSLPPSRGVPALDPMRHAGTPAFERLAAALGASPQAFSVALAAGQDPGLLMCFETDIHRTLRVVRNGSVRIELAWDQGWIRAGSRRLRVCELEMELLRGPAEALTTLAARWVTRHGLWLDTRSKAERGELLSRGQQALPAARWQAPTLPPDATSVAALRPMLMSALTQVLANASVLADASLPAQAGGQSLDVAEHLHQWRVGLRRVRSALKVFGPPQMSAGLAPAWEPAAATLCRRLGGARDADALSLSVWPLLREAGAPWLPAPRSLVRGISSEDDPGEIARGEAFNTWALALLGWCHDTTVAAPVEAAVTQETAVPPKAPAGRRSARRAQQGEWARALDRAWRPVLQGVRDFDRHAEAKRHRLRKHLRRVRYALEFVQASLPGKALTGQLKLLQAAQDALGLYNDLCVARRLFVDALALEPAAAWAAAWLSRRAERQAREAAKCLRRLVRQPVAWR